MEQKKQKRNADGRKSFLVSLGSNILPGKNIPRCLQMLAREFKLEKISSTYETPPVGPSGKRKFWNCVVQIKTESGTGPLRKKLREIEKKLGRKRKGSDKYAPRTIDLDLLAGRGFQEQAFVMVGLSEIVPRKVDTASGKTFGELAKSVRQEFRLFRKVPYSTYRIKKDTGHSKNNAKKKRRQG